MPVKLILSISMDRFYVVGSGTGNFHEQTDPKSFNLIDPPYLNVAALSTDGWAAIRFTANNPSIFYIIYIYIVNLYCWCPKIFNVQIKSKRLVTNFTNLLIKANDQMLSPNIKIFKTSAPKDFHILVNLRCRIKVCLHKMQNQKPTTSGSPLIHILKSFIC